MLAGAVLLSGQSERAATLCASSAQARAGTASPRKHARGLGAPEAQLMLAVLREALHAPATASAGRLPAERCALYGLAPAAEVLDAWLERVAAG